MKDEIPQDARPRTREQRAADAHAAARLRQMGAEANMHVAVGLPLLAGPNIVSDLLDLPEGSPLYVSTAGMVMLLRATLMYAIIRRERRERS